MPNPCIHLRDLLRLTMTPGLGPVLIGRMIEHFGSPSAALSATETGLREIRGIKPSKVISILQGMRESDRLADEELTLAEQLSVTLLASTDPGYPPLLAQTPHAPPILYVRGALDPAGADRYAVAIVGSRSCTAYGHEQAARFATHLTQAGLTIVSGGARGIDSSAHRAALRSGPAARTVAVLGCGLAHAYPPDNRELFDEIAAGRGAVVSELPLRTNPSAENFPARNRIISGLSLGVIVIEAGRRSGALITARYAADDHGREVFALPARVDSAASEGSLDLLKAGSAALVTHPTDVLDALESAARHLHQGTHAARFGSLGPATEAPDEADPGETDPGETAAPLFSPAGTAPAGKAALAAPKAQTQSISALTAPQQAILAALSETLTLDELSRETGLPPAALRSELTILEISRRIRREGTRIARAKSL